MPATIRQRLLDNHLHPPKCDDNRWEYGGFRRYRDEWAQDVAPLLPALRFTADHRARPDPGSDDGQGRDPRFQRMVPPGVGAVCGPAQALGQPGSRREAIRRQSRHLGEALMNRFQDIFDAQKALFAAGVTRTYEWRVEQL